MRLRVLLVALITLSTVAFVIGTTIERNSEDEHHESAAEHKVETNAKTETEPRTETEPSREQGEGAHAGESAEHRKAEGLPPEASTSVESTETNPRSSNDSGGKTKAEAPAETTTSESGEGHGAEGATAHSETGHEENQELKPLGIDIEAAPFVALAAAASLGLALAAWLRPRWLPLLLGIAAAMLLFAALDVREIFHQSDESRTGLAVLAGVVAALHLGAAVVAGLMGREAGQTAP